MRRVIRHAVIQPADQSIRYIPLTRNLNAIVDAADYAWLSQWNWWAHWNPRSRTFYALGKIKGRHQAMHRLILDAPANLQVDHANQNGLDNRRCNLRLATQNENQHNRRIPITNTSGFKGVSWRRRNKRWQATISVGNDKILIGIYSTVEEAANAYDFAALALFGEFARTNGNYR